MRIDILTVVPRLLEGPFADSIVQRGQDKGLVEIHVHNIRKWSKDNHQKVDDVPFGGNAGMVMTIQPIQDAIDSLRAQRDYAEVIYLTPDG
ncbi:MAG: tRNA (guanosine(37)-N1)-methyltransferase TrmD, partial [Flavobacteriales bacterium]|nr:tRNA (guanosine(37)-N1)-methyltransferase TrmD [Flavobacteriales bacterium]